MTSDPPERPHPREAARQARLRQALRDNLKKRKSQLRGRADLAAAAAGLSSDGDDETGDRAPDDRAAT